MDEQPKGQQLERIPEKDHYYVDLKSRRIWYLRRVQNDLIKIATGLIWDNKPSTLIKAARIVSLKELEKKKEKEKVKYSVVTRLMGTYLDEFLARGIAEGDKKGTLQSKRNSVKHLKEYFEAHRMDEVTNEEWLKFVHAFQLANPGFNMFNLTKHFRAVCKHLHDNGKMAIRPKIFNPFRKKEESRRKKKRHRCYTPEEILFMDAVCNDDQRLALWLGYDLGFRLDDCVKLNWERVHLSKTGSFIEFFGEENKTGFAGHIPVSDTCHNLLSDRMAKAKSPWVFPLASDLGTPMLPQQLRFEAIVKDSKVNYGSHHLLRHTRLTEDFGNKELPDTLVMKIRRVSLAIAMEHYIHPTEGDLEKFRNTGIATREKTTSIRG